MWRDSDLMDEKGGIADVWWLVIRNECPLSSSVWNGKMFFVAK